MPCHSHFRRYSWHAAHRIWYKRILRLLLRYSWRSSASTSWCLCCLIVVFRFSLSESVLAALAASSAGRSIYGSGYPLEDLFWQDQRRYYRNRFSCHQSHCRPGHDSRSGAGKNTCCDNGIGDDRSLGLHRKAPGETVKEPIVWAPVLAFVLVLCNVRVPSIVDHGLSLLGQATSGVALFASGIMLAAYKIQIDRTAISLALLKNIVQPALVLVGLRSLGYGAPIVPEAVLTTAIPSMPIVIVLAVQYHVLEGRASSCAISQRDRLDAFTIGVFIALTQ